MEKFSLIFALTLLVFGGCVAPKEYADGPCTDREYLRLSAIPFDSMTSREFEYFKMKDQECMEAQARANEMYQNWQSWAENARLGFALICAAWFIGWFLPRLLL